MTEDEWVRQWLPTAPRLIPEKKQRIADLLRPITPDQKQCYAALMGRAEEIRRSRHEEEKAA